LRCEALSILVPCLFKLVLINGLAGADCRHSKLEMLPKGKIALATNGRRFRLPIGGLHA
jgi:hypothetical protein